MCDTLLSEIPLPSKWPKNVKSSVLHAIFLAHYAIVAARGWDANSINTRVRLATENDRFKQEIGLLHEEIRIKNARAAKIRLRHRPIADRLNAWPSSSSEPRGHCPLPRQQRPSSSNQRP